MRAFPALLQALSLPSLAPRAPPPRLCAPLTITRYGAGTSLHVDLRGARTIRRLGSLPQQPKGSVRVVFVSDTHSRIANIVIPDGDVLVHTGDITFCSQGGLSALQVFNEDMAALPHAHKVVIAGNHDRRLLQLGKVEARKVLSACHYLENSGVHLCGLHFWGSPFSAKHKRRSSNTAFQYSEEMQRTVWRYTPNNVDVLLTHGASAPSPLLCAAIARVQPYVHAHGHDHEFHGATLQWEPLAPVRLDAPAPADGAPPLPLPRHVLDHAARPDAFRRAADARLDGSGNPPASSLREGPRQLWSQQPPPRSPPSARRPPPRGGSRSASVGGAQARPARPTLVTINAAICNKAYEPIQLPIVVDLPAMSAPVRASPGSRAHEPSSERAARGRASKREQEAARRRIAERAETRNRRGRGHGRGGPPPSARSSREPRP